MQFFNWASEIIDDKIKFQQNDDNEESNFYYYRRKQLRKRTN